MAKNIALTATQIMAAEQLRLIWNSKKKELGLTQEKVAQLCQWNTQAAFNAYLQARIPLNTEAILRLSKVFQIHPTEIMPALADILPTNDLEIAVQQEIFSHSEKMIINMLRSVTDEKTTAIIKKNLEDLAFQYREKEQLSSELMMAYEEIASNKAQKEKRADEL
ncbi:MAG: helix-turn-helix transcriptional regulator, partial [Methylococcaceae bacterium]